MSSYLSALCVHLLKYSPSGMRGRTGPAALEPVQSTAPVGPYLHRHLSLRAMQPRQPGSTNFTTSIQFIDNFRVFLPESGQQINKYL